METPTQAPAAPAPETPPAPVAETAAPAPVESKPQNISGPELAAALRSRRQARQPASSAATAPTGQTQPAPDSIPANTPAPAPEPEAPDPSQAASATETEIPPAEPTEPTEPETPTEDTDTKPKETKGVQSMQKRIDQLTARLRDAESKLAKAEAEKPAPAKPAPIPGEFSHVPQIAEAQHEVELQSKALQWLWTNQQGGEILDDNGKVIYSIDAEQVPKEIVATQRALARAEANAAWLENAWRAQRNQLGQFSHAQAEKFDWYADQESPQRKSMDEIIALVPELKRLPSWELYAAHAVDSFHRAQAAQAKAQPSLAPATAEPVVPPPTQKPPKVAVPSPSGSVRRGNPIERQLAAAQAAYEKSGSAQHFKQVQILKRQLNKAA